MDFPNFTLRNVKAGLGTGADFKGGASGQPAEAVFGNLLALRMKEPGMARRQNLEAAAGLKAPASEEERKKLFSSSLRLSEASRIPLSPAGRPGGPAALKARRKGNGGGRLCAEDEGRRESVPGGQAEEKFPAGGAGQSLLAQIPGKINELIDQAARRLGLDANLVRAVVKVESNFNPQAVSSAGAMGLMQLMPGTAKDLGVERPFEPYANLLGGINYLKQMLERYDGDLDKALAAYNWGPGNLDRYGRQGRLPAETRNYISAVNRHYRRYASPAEPLETSSQPPSREVSSQLAIIAGGLRAEALALSR